MIELIRYNETFKEEWNRFIDESKNGTFLFNRYYMDYHADRFPDHSYIVLKEKKIIAVFPATLKNNILSSHSGLTYGGLVSNIYATQEEISDSIKLIIQQAKKERLDKIIYKKIPYIYNVAPSDEDLYVLFKNKFTLIRRDLSTVVNASSRLRFRQLRQRGVKKALREGISIEESDDFNAFWDILTENLLQKYYTKPVHSVEEILRLKEHFPNNIKLIGAFEKEKMIAGIVLYKTKTCSHCQYISASAQGKEKGALDLLFFLTLDKELREKRYFDFGTSMSPDGKNLNSALLFQKEGFGGRGVCYDTYEIVL